MSAVELRCKGPFAYREAVPERAAGHDAVPVLCLHGFPETSWMWRHVLARLAEDGHRAVAPDRPGCGRSELDPPATWTRQVEAVERFADLLGLPPVVLVVHDWGGLIGLRWACDHPERVRGLVISASGFFPDGKWHGMAEGLRNEGTGEQLLAGIDHDGFAALMSSLGTGFDDQTIGEYWLSFGTEEGRAAVLEMYRSGNFEELAPYEGRLAALDVPTLLLWGETDDFAPVATAHRLERELPRSELRFIEGAGHFLYSDQPELTAAAVGDFVTRLGSD